MPAVPIITAALELGMSRSQLLRAIGAGAPTVRRGSRGRGKQTLVCVDAVAAWLESSKTARADEQQALELAGRLPDLVGDAIYDETFIKADGPHKRATAGELARAWFAVTNALLEELRSKYPAVPELQSVPEKINRLRVIFADSGTIDPGSK